MDNECIGSLGSLAANTTSQLDVLGHDGDTLGVDGAQVCVLEQSNEVSLTCLLYYAHTNAQNSLDS